MKKKLEELIALGASVSAHCFPCFEYHLKQARKLGLSDKEIHQAVRAGFAVMNGAGEKMLEKIKTELPRIKVKENESCSRDQGEKERKFAFPLIHF
jgi:AhpD family alkylhydroperoxidase